ncbi:MAG: Bug family tripartite tricarboxylate transporter substrate binding protein [Burkholderiaceae bacterium]
MKNVCGLRGLIRVLLGATLSLLAALPAHAQYPERTVRIVVPYGGGGGIDLFTRAIAQRLAEVWKQTVIVENKPGAGTTIGSDYVAKASPDGYTLLMNASTLAINFGTYDKLPFKTSDFAPITMAARMPVVLVVSSKLPADNMASLIALSKTRPGGVSIGSSGQGGISHLALELLTRRSALQATHVPYKTNNEAIPDVIGGRIDGFFATAAGVAPHIRKGTVKPIALSSTTRFRLMPDVPTMIESGVRDYEILSWFGLFAPAGTPPEIVNKIHRDMGTVLKRPDIQAVLDSQALEASFMPPDEFRRAFEAEAKSWVDLVKDAGLKF